MADYFFSLAGGLTARLSTPAAIHDRMLQTLSSHLPGVRLLARAPERLDITLEHRPSSRTSLSGQEQSWVVEALPSNGMPEDIYHLFWGILRRALVLRGLYPVHAACVGEEGRFVLLAGHSGAGKTSLAVKLAKERGFKVFSGSKTVTKIANHQIAAIDGTRTMTAIARERGKFHRYAFVLEPSQYAAQTSVELAAIFLIRLNDGVEEDHALTPLSALHTLFPLFLDAVNADVVVGGSAVFDGAPPIECKQALAIALAGALAQLPVRKISGNLEFLARTVSGR